MDEIDLNGFNLDLFLGRRRGLCNRPGEFKGDKTVKINLNSPYVLKVSVPIT
jgi:hypothetical protein